MYIYIYAYKFIDLAYLSAYLGWLKVGGGSAHRDTPLSKRNFLLKREINNIQPYMESHSATTPYRHLSQNLEIVPAVRLKPSRHSREPRII